MSRVQELRVLQDLQCGVSAPVCSVCPHGGGAAGKLGGSFFFFLLLRFVHTLIHTLTHTLTPFTRFHGAVMTLPNSFLSEYEPFSLTKRGVKKKKKTPPVPNPESRLGSLPRTAERPPPRPMEAETLFDWDSQTFEVSYKSKRSENTRKREIEKQIERSRCPGPCRLPAGSSAASIRFTPVFRNPPLLDYHWLVIHRHRPF